MARIKLAGRCLAISEVMPEAPGAFLGVVERRSLTSSTSMGVVRMCS